MQRVVTQWALSIPMIPQCRCWLLLRSTPPRRGTGNYCFPCAERTIVAGVCGMAYIYIYIYDCPSTGWIQQALTPPQHRTSVGCIPVPISMGIGLRCRHICASTPPCCLQLEGHHMRFVTASITRMGCTAMPLIPSSQIRGHRAAAKTKPLLHSHAAISDWPVASRASATLAALAQCPSE